MIGSSEVDEVVVQETKAVCVCVCVHDLNHFFKLIFIVCFYIIIINLL